MKKKKLFLSLKLIQFFLSLKLVFYKLIYNSSFLFQKKLKFFIQKKLKFFIHSTASAQLSG